jgi:serpin B
MRFRYVVIAAALSLITACEGGGPAEPIDELPRQLTAAETRLIEADNGFALKLFREVTASEDATDNVFISPLSIAMALGMVYNGADGNTRDEMTAMLEVDGMSVEEINGAYRSLIDLLLSLDDSRVEINLANSIWSAAGMDFAQSFIDTNREYFDAQVQTLNFTNSSAPNTINNWVSDNTNGKIEEIVPNPIPENVVMYLINAIYFNGKWTGQFAKNQTTDRPFHLEGGTSVTVPTMRHAEAVDVRAVGADGVQIVELPYGGGAFVMTIFIPQGTGTVQDIINRLDEPTWHAWLGALNEVSAIVRMPKFRVEYGKELAESLKALGMNEAFTPGANLSKMRPDNDIFVSRVTHKAFVDVNEEGTEAAAATSVEIGVVCACGPMEIPVDRPFLFAIRERFSGAILFMGKIAQP